MAEIKPFFGIKYNPEKIKDLSLVITQPYDKITPQMQEEYYKRHPYNFVRLILGKSQDRYQESYENYHKWQRERILIKDERPGIFPYTQEFEIEGERRIRKGFIAALRLYDFEEGIVLPHERTHSKPKEDRYRLFIRTKKNYEQVFMLYSDPENKINSILEEVFKKKPEIEARGEYGVIHRMWSIYDPEIIRSIARLMEDKILLIADGHHRYETSLRVRNELKQYVPFYSGKECFNYRMVTFVNMYDEGLVILPTHRLFKRIPVDFDEFIKKSADYFDIEKISKANIEEEVKKYRDKHAYGIYRKDDGYIFILKDASVMKKLLPDRSDEYRNLDVSILHAVVVENLLGISKNELEDVIDYERYTQNVIEKVDKGDYVVGIIMNPTRPEEVQQVALKRERMPQKSTDFYPKLVSGLVIFDISPDEVIPEV